MFSKNYNLFGLAGIVFSCFSTICWFLIAHDDYYLIPIHLILTALCFAIFSLSGGVVALFSLRQKKRLGYSIKNIFYFLFTTVLLVLINVAASRKEVFFFDSTEQNVYTLSPQSEEVLSKVTAPLKIRIFVVEGLVEPKLQILLDRIEKDSKNISWSAIDIERNPTQVERFGITEANTIHFEYQTASGPSIRKLSPQANDEQSIINTILKLTSSSQKKAYFLTGHEEPRLDSLEKGGYRFFSEAMEGENFELKPLLLEDDAKIPTDADLLIIAAPKSELLDFELNAVSDYVKSNGKLLLLHEPRTSSSTTALAKQFGITIGDNLVVDTFVQLFANPGFGLEPVVTDFQSHPISTKFNAKVYFSSVSSVTKTSANDNDIEVLAQTSKVSWAETNLELLLSEAAEAEKGDDDIIGPVPIAATWQKGESRVAVFGDSDFASNLHFRKAGNRDFLLNTVNWLVGDTAGITLRAKTLRPSLEPITAEQINKMFIATAIAIPEVILLAGLIFWWRRKQGLSQ